jgi:hypothetical protein
VAQLVTAGPHNSRVTWACQLESGGARTLNFSGPMMSLLLGVYGNLREVDLHVVFSLLLRDTLGVDGGVGP